MQFPEHPTDAFDARPLFAPLTASLLDLLHGLSPADWRLPSGVGAWTTHQLVAHLVDGMLRRVAAERDGWQPPPEAAITDYSSLVAHINRINHLGVAGMFARSPQQLIASISTAAAELTECFSARALDSPAFYAVTWAGEQQSLHWFDIARELTEQWHHQQQLRVAVGAPELDSAELTHAVVRSWMLGLPFAYRAATGTVGQTIEIRVDGSGGGCWRLQRGTDSWTFQVHPEAMPTAQLAIPVSALWRLYSKLLSPDQARTQMQIAGDANLAEPLLHYLPFLVLR